MRRKFPTYDLWSLLSPPEGTVWDYWMILLYKNKCFNKNYTYMHIRGYAVSIQISFYDEAVTISHYFIWMSEVIVPCNSSAFLIDLMDKMLPI